MPITITSTTDTPEDVASAMGAEIETDEGAETTETADETTTETTDEETVKPPAKGKIKTETDDEEETETETEVEDADEEPEVEEDSAAKPKKITGYKKKALRLEEENRLLLDLLKKQQTSDRNDREVDEPEEEVVVVDKTPKTYSGQVEPKFEDFKDEKDPYAAFIVSHSKWSHAEAVAQIRAEGAQKDANTQQTVVLKAFNDRLADVRKEGGIYSDYDEVLAATAAVELPVSKLMQDIAQNSRDKSGTSICPDIYYYFATHPEHCQEIAKLSPVEQAAEMGVVRTLAMAETAKRTGELKAKPKIEKSDKSDKSELKPKVESVVNRDGSTVNVTVKPKLKPTLPPPIKPVGKRSAPAAGDLATIAESGDFKAYERRRMAEGRKYR